MRTVPVLAAIAALAAAAPALAAPVSIDVRDAAGKPIAGAVVMVSSPRGPAPASRIKGPFVVAQQNIAFQPHVLIVPVGASVSFPNKDKVRHHVYSFAKAKKFELKLYGQDESRAVTFDKPGIVALGCNIHDSMSGFVIVSDTAFAATTDARGHVAFADVPAGPVKIAVWHPSIRAADNVVAQDAAVAAAGLTTTVAPRTK